LSLEILKLKESGELKQLEEKWWMNKNECHIAAKVREKVFRMLFFLITHEMKEQIAGMEEEKSLHVMMIASKMRFSYPFPPHYFRREIKDVLTTAD
jgi:hypothetical protein